MYGGSWAPGHVVSVVRLVCDLLAARTCVLVAACCVTVRLSRLRNPAEPDGVSKITVRVCVPLASVSFNVSVAQVLQLGVPGKVWFATTVAPSSSILRVIAPLPAL